MPQLKEEWKPIKNYEGLYEISNLGRVKSLAKEWNNGGRKKDETILKFVINKDGYKSVNLCKNGKNKTFRIHMIIWDNFGNRPRNGRILQIDHKDNDKLNNHIENLHLLSNRENVSKYQSTQKRSSKYIGVYWHKKAKKWLAQIRIGNIRKHLGLFTEEQKAHLKYQNELQKINRYYSLT